MTPAPGPNAHQPVAPSHVPPTVAAGTSAPVGGSGITGPATQQYVDYSMPMAGSGYLATTAPQAAATNLQQPSTTSGPMLATGQYAHYNTLPGQQENAGQTGRMMSYCDCST